MNRQEINLSYGPEAVLINSQSSNSRRYHTIDTFNPTTDTKHNPEFLRWKIYNFIKESVHMRAQYLFWNIDRGGVHFNILHVSWGEPRGCGGARKGYQTVPGYIYWKNIPIQPKQNSIPFSSRHEDGRTLSYTRPPFFSQNPSVRPSDACLPFYICT